MPGVSVILHLPTAVSSSPRAVSSVAAQTLADWELIAVGDYENERGSILAPSLGRIVRRVSTIDTEGFAGSDPVSGGR